MNSKAYSSPAACSSESRGDLSQQVVGASHSVSQCRFFFFLFFFFFFALAAPLVENKRIHPAVFRIDGDLQPHRRFAFGVVGFFGFRRRERDRRFLFAFDKPLNSVFADIRFVADVVAGVGRVRGKRQYARARREVHVVNFWPEDFGVPQLTPFGMWPRRRARTASAGRTPWQVADICERRSRGRWGAARRVTERVPAHARHHVSKR